MEDWPSTILGLSALTLFSHTMLASISLKVLQMNLRKALALHRLLKGLPPCKFLSMYHENDKGFYYFGFIGASRIPVFLEFLHWWHYIVWKNVAITMHEIHSYGSGCVVQDLEKTYTWLISSMHRNCSLKKLNIQWLKLNPYTIFVLSKKNWKTQPLLFGVAQTCTFSSSWA